jgi:hypothetical protein
LGTRAIGHRMGADRMNTFAESRSCARPSRVPCD